MRAKYLTPATLVMLCLWISVGAAQRLTLQEAIALALEASEELRISREDVHIAEFQVREAGSRRWPQLDFSSQYVFISEVMSFDQPPTTFSLPQIGSVTIPGRKTDFGDEHTVDFKLQVIQPLFTGFRLKKAHRAARYQVEQMRAGEERTRWEIRCRTEELYINVQKASALKEVTRLRVGTLERHLLDAGRRVEEGTAPPEVSARAGFALSQARLKHQEAEHAYQLAEIALREFLNLPDRREMLQLDSLELTPVDVSGQGVEYALANRAEFKVLDAQRYVITQKMGIEKAAYYPTLTAFGALDYGRPGVDRLANDWMSFEMAGVNLNWTLWDWKNRKSKVEQMRAADRQMDELRKALKSKVRLEVQGAQLALDNARRKMEVASQGLQLSADILRWVEARYAQGVATETEFIDAQADHSASQIEYIITLGDCRLAALALKRASGGELDQ